MDKNSEVKVITEKNQMEKNLSLAFKIAISKFEKGEDAKDISPNGTNSSFSFYKKELFIDAKKTEDDEVSYYRISLN